MAVPKKKTTPGKKRQRSSGKFLKPAQYYYDDSGNPALSHRIDSNGMYNGRQVITPKIKNKNTEIESESEE